MLSAVQFNRQLDLWAEKVEDVRAYAELPIKFQVVDLSGAEFTPQQFFGIGLTSTKTLSPLSKFLFIL